MYLRVFSKADATRTAKHLQLSAFKRWMDGLGSLQLAHTEEVREYVPIEIYPSHSAGVTRRGSGVEWDSRVR